MATIKSASTYQRGYLITGGLFYLIVLILCRNHPFFGDCINLGSRYAQWFLESNFSGLIAPAGVDSGNPPFFGLYLAICWNFLGKTLPVSHLAMFPFIVGIVWGYFQIAKIYLKGNWLWLSLTIIVEVA